MNDWLDILDGIAVGLAFMFACAAIVFVAPVVIYYAFAGLYAVWQMVGVM